MSDPVSKAETSGQRTVLVAYSPVSRIIDAGQFAERFPEFALAHIDYELPHKLRTDRSVDPHGSLAAEPALSNDQRAALVQAEILVALDAPRDLPACAPRLRWVQTVGSGTDQYGVSGLRRGNIALTNAAGIAAAPISEWVVGRIFSIFKCFDLHAAQQRRHVWEPAYGDLIAGKTIVVVGLGAIGQEIAWRCAALGMIVIGVRRTPCQPGEEPRGVTSVHHPRELPALVGQADIVVAAVPAGAESDSLFDAQMFAAMRASSAFINVGRGNSVDEDALIAALRSGHLRAAAIDVARQEPLPPENPLWDAPNLQISPHSSSSQDGYMERVWALFLDNLDAYRAGRPHRNVVTPPPEPAPAVA